jgi:predicted ester cyclase
VKPTITADSQEARENVEVILQFFAEGLRPGGENCVARLLADDFADQDPDPEVAPTRAGVLRKLQDLWSAFPDGSFVPEIVVASGDMVSVRSIFTCTRPGPAGRAMVRFHDFYRLGQGRIVEHWHVFDATAMASLLEG